MNCLIYGRRPLAYVMALSWGHPLCDGFRKGTVGRKDGVGKALGCHAADIAPVGSARQVVNFPLGVQVFNAALFWAAKSVADRYAGFLGAVVAGRLKPAAIITRVKEKIRSAPVFGRRPGQRVKADRFAPKVLKLVGEGQSYREISHRLGLSKNTVLAIVKRDRAA
jgi:hypothetical protein